MIQVPTGSLLPACPTRSDEALVDGNPGSVEEVSFRSGDCELAGQWFTPRADSISFVIIVVGGAVPFLEHVRFEMHRTFERAHGRPTRISARDGRLGGRLPLGAALEIVDSPRGRERLERLRALTRHFEAGLGEIGIETIPGEHPVVPLMIRDTGRTRALVQHLFDHGVLVTGLAYPVVPRGDEEIRTQINADHTPEDLDRVLEILAGFSRG